ncbi:TPA: DUF551 domain-containing protein [Shigella sonnei]
MSTITKERIELFIKSPLENGLTRGEQMEVARIALASLEADPIGEVSEKRYGLIMDGTVDLGGKSTYRIIKGEKAMKLFPLGTKFYTAPPAPVSVPAAMEIDDDFDSAFEHGKAVGWNACRAAMLQSQGNCIKDGWISCSDRMPEDTKMLLAFSQGEIVAAYWNWVVNPIDYKKYRAFTYLSGNILDDVTHWMPLPEPPL